MENNSDKFADVIAVSTSGQAKNYRFSVTLSSPDTGCDQYANWWEVISEDGKLLYRRILLHSHVHEQPFTRSGGPVNIESGQTVIIRAHMNNSGYGGTAFKGSVDNGFNRIELSPDFASDLEKQEPLPGDCPN